MTIHRKRRARRTPDSGMEIINVPLSKIHPYKNNPRINDNAVKAVKASIKDFGFLVPIILSPSKEIVAGHTRYKALKELGWTQAPCLIANKLSRKQLKAFRAIDNKTAEIAEWDMDLLAEEITSLSNSGIDFTNYGWTQEEVDCLSDVVTDDCLVPAGDSEEDTKKVVGSVSRAPRTTRFVFGDFIFYVPSDVFKRWSNEVRTDNSYNEKDIVADLQSRLGLVPYLESEE